MLSWHLLPWWCHQMETFSALLAICAGNSPENASGKWLEIWHVNVSFPPSEPFRFLSQSVDLMVRVDFILDTHPAEYTGDAFHAVNAFKQLCIMMIMRWLNAPTSEYDLGVSKYHSSHANHWVHGDHDDVIKWKHFPRNWPFVRGIHRSPVKSAHRGRWRGALMFSLICVWINGWVNNREAGDLRRHCAHYDVIVRAGDIDGLVQERRNSIANALELRLYCINPSICSNVFPWLQIIVFQLKFYISYANYVVYCINDPISLMTLTLHAPVSYTRAGDVSETVTTF